MKLIIYFYLFAGVLKVSIDKKGIIWFLDLLKYQKITIYFLIEIICQKIICFSRYVRKSILIKIK